MPAFIVDIDTESPFQPGKPVYPDRFKGRHENVNKIVRYVNNALNCDVQHFFLTGKKGVGKTSLIDFVTLYFEEYKDMAGIYVSNKGNDTLEKLVNSIVEAFLEEIPRSNLKNIFQELFGSLESLEINGAKIRFRPNESVCQNNIDNFNYLLGEFIEKLDCKGLFLVIDDINGITESKAFVDWYKRFADTIELNRNIDLPLYILLAGYPEKFDSLILEDLSFGRIFHHDEIDNLNDDEVVEFFRDTFAMVGIECEDAALDILKYFSAGSPLMMQQIGDSVFWQTDSNIIDEKTAKLGIINAANELARKQIRPILNRIRSKAYISILLKLAKHNLFEFKKSNAESFLNKNEKKVFKDFLSRMVDIGILNSIGVKNSGEYEFSNKLYFIYFLIKSTADEW